MFLYHKKGLRMIAPTDWYAREFRFELPLEAWAGIVERLRGTPARLADRLLPLPEDLLTQCPGEEWSIQEHAGHLFDLCEIEIGRLDDILSGAPFLRIADLENRKTYAANYNSRALKDILASFHRERSRFVERLERLDIHDIQLSALHPRLKQPLRVIDHAWFFAEHDDHHLAQITFLINTL